MTTTTTAPAPPDNRLWYLHQASSHWTPPLSCGHPDSVVFGPCFCHDQDQP